MTNKGQVAGIRKLSQLIIGVVSAHGQRNPPSTAARAPLGRFAAQVMPARHHPRLAVVG